MPASSVYTIGERHDLPPGKCENPISFALMHVDSLLTGGSLPRTMSWSPMLIEVSSEILREMDPLEAIGRTAHPEDALVEH